MSEDGWVDDVPAVNWSTSVEQAEWIAERLAPSGTGLVTEVVPGGFEAYARLLHPAKGPGQRWEDTVRWAEIAAWSGMPLRSDSQFASVALPPHEPQDPAPWDAGPLRGSLDAVDASALVGICDAHRGTRVLLVLCLGRLRLGQRSSLYRRRQPRRIAESCRPRSGRGAGRAEGAAAGPGLPAIQRCRR